MPKTGKKLLSWDTSDMLEQQVKFLMENDPALTKQEAENMAYNDQDLQQINWDDMTDYLTELMNKKNSAGWWYAEVKNFGWQSLSGHKFFAARTGQEFLSMILPKTDCTFNIHAYGRGFAIQNYHHDSPTGNEWYYILPATQKQIRDEEFRR